MLPTLWFGNASSTPTELTIRDGEQVLGRAADADLCVSETFVSTYHARLMWQKGQLKVLDLNSTNGTMVNGVPVVGWTTLTDGDVIEFGGIEAVVEMPRVIDLDEPSASSPPPPQPERMLTTEEVPRVLADGSDDTAPIERQLPDEVSTSPTGRVAPVTLPPGLPTGITITDIEAVAEGYDDFSDQFGAGVFGTHTGYEGHGGSSGGYGGSSGGDDGYDGSSGGDHPESVRHRGRSRRRLLENGPRSDEGTRPSPAFNRDGVSPIVIIIAVALLVVIILAAVFFS